MSKKAITLTERRLGMALGACHDYEERAMVLCSVKAGMRACEIAGLKWSQVDFLDGYFRLTTTKGNKPRNVPIKKEVASELRMLKETASGDHVFKRNAKAVSMWFHRLYKSRLGWEGYSSHSGRRTFCTNAANNITSVGGNIRDVQALMGHEDLKTTQGYIETSEDAQKRVIDII